MIDAENVIRDGEVQSRNPAITLRSMEICNIQKLIAMKRAITNVKHWAEDAELG